MTGSHEVTGSIPVGSTESPASAAGDSSFVATPPPPARAPLTALGLRHPRGVDAPRPHKPSARAQKTSARGER